MKGKGGFLVTVRYFQRGAVGLFFFYEKVLD